MCFLVPGSGGLTMKLHISFLSIYEDMTFEPESLG